MTELRFEDRRDFEDADRGFIAKLDPGVVTSRDGRVVWDSDAYGFLSGTAQTRPTPACGDKGSCAPGRACIRLPTGSTRSGALTCRT